MMRKQRIGMLALQETHYTEDYVAEIAEKYGDTIHVEYSKPVGRRASRAEGVALAFYKPTTNVIGLEKKVVIPGRRIRAQRPAENREFWETNEKFIDEYPEWKPDVVCMDTNIAPEAIDRLPAHEDDQAAVEAMRRFLRKCDLETECPSHSRIDRIYMKRSRILQNHKRVSCEVTTAAAPEQGHGRYTTPIYVAKTLKMVKMVDKTGKELTRKMESATGDNRTDNNNPQTLYAKWKHQVSDEMRREAKTIIPKAKKKVAELQIRVKEVLKDTRIEDAVKQQEVADLEKEINRIGAKYGKRSERRPKRIKKC
ncbi:hypothetical protein BDZ89DRAFT_1073963 [Hymenopellis radicata]|nr:hypothetical protein BDZ89DRAFT_1073963 [Hymenopellis radicata]